jgi:LysR family transcriptional regulator, regulator for bpeEF and oprC
VTQKECEESVDKLHAMRQFMRVAEAKSFSVAARRLEVSPSAVSKIITGLEKELGFALFHRSTRYLSLTVAGVTYLAHCHEIFQAMEDAENEGKQQRETPRGTLKVGLHPAFRIAFFSEIARFLEKYRDVELETRITNSPSVLLDEGFDVLIRSGALPDSNLVARQIGWFDLVVAASPDYLRRYGTPKAPADLQRHRVALPARIDDPSSSHWEFFKGKERCIVKVPSCVRVRDGMGLPETVIGGAGIARLYRIAFMRAINDGLVKPILTDWTGRKDPAYAVFPSARSITSKSKAIVEFVSELMARSEQQERSQ